MPNRCRAGAYLCQNGGRACVGGVARSPELCNGIDDDCNGIVDDVPGLGLACSGVGVITIGPCTAAYACTGRSGPGPNGLTCTQKVGPGPELCNGLDDDCSGKADDNLVDPRVGVAGGLPCKPLAPGADKAPCSPGTTVCRGGGIACEGQVLPQPNVCDKPPTDCSGNPSGAGLCPDGSQCVDGKCAPECGLGEFPCPGGFVCDVPKNVCIPE